jgi:carbon-monoxide dehydrogenase small subunit
MKTRRTWTLNGKTATVEIPGIRRLIDVLREDLGLTGTKEGCGEGECGACTVLMNGEAVNSCLLPICQVQGASITTIEGLGQMADHPMQKSFLEHGAVQCGFCTPGLILSSTAFLKENPNPTRAEIRRALAGNLCRCTGYQKIINAVYDEAFAKGEEK